MTHKNGTPMQAKAPRGVSRRNVLAGAAGLSALAGAGATAGCTTPAPGTMASAAGSGELPTRGEFVIRGAHVLTMDPAIPDLPRGDVHVRDGNIVAVGANIAAPGAEAIRGDGMIAMPGFVETHWHLWNCFCRAYFREEDPHYAYFPLTQRVGVKTEPVDAYRSVRLGVAEALASGITTVHNWCHNTRGPAWADAEIQAMVDMGIRGRYSYGGPQAGPTNVPMDLADLARVKRQWFSSPAATDGRLTLGIVSRNLVPGQSIRGAITFEMAEFEWGKARELGLPITLHASPKDLVLELDRRKLLGPDVQLVHPMFTSAEECALLAERRTTYATSPIGEVARPPDGGEIRFGELLQAGVRVSLSLDETVEGNADYFNVMRILYKYHTHRMGFKMRSTITPKRMVELATIEGAKALGFADKAGSLTPGKRADLILVRTTDANMFPMIDPWNALVFCATPANVDTVVADGRIIRAGGRFTRLDEGRVMREASETAARLAPVARG